MRVQEISICAPGDSASRRVDQVACAADAEAVLRRAVGHADAVLIAGRDLLRWPELLACGRMAAGLGFREVAVRSNHLEGCSPAWVRQLAEAGIQAVEVPWLAPDATVHDRYVRQEGSFERQVEAMGAILGQGLVLRLRLMASVLNAGELRGCAEAIAARVPAVQRVWLGLLPIRTPQHPKGVLPDWQGLRSDLRDCLGWLHERGIAARIGADSGIPCCLLRSEPDQCAWFYRGPPVLGAQSPGGMKLAECARCRLHALCPGIHPLAARQKPEALREIVTAFERVPDTLPAEGAQAKERERLRTVGSGSRLRWFTRWEDFLRFHWDSPVWSEPGCSPLYISKAEYDAMEVDGRRGPRIKLLRCPCFNKTSDFNFFAMPPLGIMMLGGMLRRHGFDVQLRDLAVETQRSPWLSDAERDVMWDHERLRRRLRGEGDDPLDVILDKIATALEPRPSELFGLSVESTEDLTFSLLMAARLKARADVHVVLGGRILEDAAPLLRAHPAVDWIVRGEGEVPLLMLAAALGGQGRIARVPSLIHRVQGEIRENPRATHDLDIFELPEPIGLELGAYDPRSFPGGHRAFPYFFIKDCPFRCAFCGELSKGQFRVRSPRKVADDLATLRERHGIRHVYFLNTLINIRPDYLLGFLEAMEARRPGVEWTDCARPSGIDVSLFPRMRAVGCVNLTWGVDAGSDRLQRTMQKGIRLDEAEGILRAAHGAGIRNTLNLIVGLPGEREEDRVQTRAFLHRVRPVCSDYQIHAFRFLHTATLFRHPSRFGLVARDQGCDEISGPTWEERQESIAAFQKELLAITRAGGG
ncbi:MAG: radical SAM protein [Deltaproteobacteria bacterium]|nr:radical SAM protein [Deltaproteobacteria bacterium]